MDFLGFTLSVWAAIAFGVFFLAMVVACTSDRSGSESPKWIVLLLGAAVFGLIYWGEWSWHDLLSASFWKGAGIYTAIGLAYSIIEFLLTIRKDERRWAQAWNQFKVNSMNPSPNDSATESLSKKFVAESNNYYTRNRLVQVEIDPEGKVVPSINRGQLAESIGCWTAFWPAYAVRDRKSVV